MSAYSSYPKCNTRRLASTVSKLIQCHYIYTLGENCEPEHLCDTWKQILSKFIATIVCSNEWKIAGTDCLKV